VTAEATFSRSGRSVAYAEGVIATTPGTGTWGDRGPKVGTPALGRHMAPWVRASLGAPQPRELRIRTPRQLSLDARSMAA